MTDDELMDAAITLTHAVPKLRRSAAQAERASVHFLARGPEGEAAAQLLREFADAERFAAEDCETLVRDVLREIEEAA